MDGVGMSNGAMILARLAARCPTGERVVIVAAHPDDETIGLGAQLCHFDDGLIVHVTNGAPRHVRPHGFATSADYASARRTELAAALSVGGAGGLRTHCLDIVDQEAMHYLVFAANCIRELLLEEKPGAIITHAYEGGHPDHDAAAFAVHCACRLIEAPPEIMEMTSHFRHNGIRVIGEFLPCGQPATSFRLNEEELKRKRAMMACFVTQRAGLAKFILPFERLRLAPFYDFLRPPHEGELDYETMGFGISAMEWRRCSAAALTEFGLKRLPLL
jgi:LmbE family N-acetylglucosaminyl deacetylase